MNNLEIIESTKEYKSFVKKLIEMIEIGFFDKEADFYASKERVVKCVEHLLNKDIEDKNA